MIGTCNFQNREFAINRKLNVGGKQFYEIHQTWDSEITGELIGMTVTLTEGDISDIKLKKQSFESSDN